MSTNSNSVPLAHLEAGAQTDPVLARMLIKTVLADTTYTTLAEPLFTALLHSIVLDVVLERVRRDDIYALDIAQRIVTLLKAQREAAAPQTGESVNPT